MNPRRNARAVLVDSITHGAPAGAFKFFRRDDIEGLAGILYACPCGCGAVHSAPFKGSNPGRAEWAWDGNREAPTLKPSLGLHPKDGRAADGSGYHWHGWLTAGEFKEC